MDEVEFANYSLKEKTHLIFEHGNHLITRQYLYYSIKLYSLFNFYVEIWYIPATNKIDTVETISINDVLELYGDEIDISELLS